MKCDGIRPNTPLRRADAIAVVTEFVRECYEVRLHSALGDVTPYDMLAGRQEAIFTARDAKLEKARAVRADARQQHRVELATERSVQNVEATESRVQNSSYTQYVRSEDRALRGRNLSAAPVPLTSDCGSLISATAKTLASTTTCQWPHAKNPGVWGRAPSCLERHP